MEKEIVVAVVFEVALLGFLIRMWLHRNEESQTSHQPDDLKNLDAMESRVAARRSGKTTWTDAAKKRLMAAYRRAEQIDRHGAEK